MNKNYKYNYYKLGIYIYNNNPAYFPILFFLLSRTLRHKYIISHYLSDFNKIMKITDKYFSKFFPKITKAAVFQNKRAHKAPS